MRGLAQTDPAEAELAVVAARAPTATTTVVFTGLKPGFAALLHLLGSLSHPLKSPRRPSRRPLGSRPPRRPRPPRRLPARASRMRRGSLPSIARVPPARPRPAGEP